MRNDWASSAATNAAFCEKSGVLKYRMMEYRHVSMSDDLAEIQRRHDAYRTNAYRNMVRWANEAARKEAALFQEIVRWANGQNKD